jgi:hypothetical protein
MTANPGQGRGKRAHSGAFLIFMPHGAGRSLETRGCQAKAASKNPFRTSAAGVCRGSKAVAKGGAGDEGGNSAQADGLNRHHMKRPESAQKNMDSTVASTATAQNQRDVPCWDG